MHWHMFGPSGHKTRPPGLVIESYTQRAPIPSAADDMLVKWKSIVDPRKVSSVISPHMFLLEDGRKGAYDEHRRWVPKSERAKAASSILRLNHYYTKSEEELAAKIDKGSAAYAPSETRPGADLRAQAMAKLLEGATVKDEAILRFAAPLRERVAAAQAGVSDA
jgi:hypothetical protein